MKMSIFKIFRNKIQRKKDISERKLVHPNREWMIGLLCTAILFIGTSLYFGYDFYTYSQGDKDQSAQEVVVVKYQQAKVESILNAYHEKAAVYSRLRQNKTPFQETTNDKVLKTTPLADPQKGQYSGDASTTGSGLPTLN